MEATIDSVVLFQGHMNYRFGETTLSIGLLTYERSLVFRNNLWKPNLT